LTIIALGEEIHPVKLTVVKLTNGETILYRDDGTVFTCGHFDYFG
jgi:hypothetical protein